MSKINTIRRNLRSMRLSRLLQRISMSPILEEGGELDDTSCFDDYNPAPVPERRISRAELQLLFGKELGVTASAKPMRTQTMAGAKNPARARTPSNLPYILRVSAPV